MTPEQTACSIRDIRMRNYEENPEYRAVVDRQIERELSALVTIPEGTCERIWRERIQPEIEKSAVAK
jgi:hypothetical protein